MLVTLQSLWDTTFFMLVTLQPPWDTTFFMLVTLQRGWDTNSWREDGHSLRLEDLSGVLDELPGHLVVGTGAAGRMRLQDEVLDELPGCARGIEVEVMNTAEAVRRYNELVGLDVPVAVTLHLTC